jgi:hypothetical protein
MSEHTKTRSIVLESPRAEGVVRDSVFIVFIMFLSAVLYIRGLGFYSDDWSNLYSCSLSKDQSLSGIIRFVFSARPDSWFRPCQVVYYAMLYSLFGVQPLGYHVVISTVLAAGIVLFYLALRELRFNRLLALAVPTVFGLLPHYSTDRIWFAAFGGNLSMALYFSSLYADVRMVAPRRTPLWFWKLTSAVSLLGSILAYEVFLPLFFLNLFVVL